MAAFPGFRAYKWREVTNFVRLASPTCERVTSAHPNINEYVGLLKNLLVSMCIFNHKNFVKLNVCTPASSAITSAITTRIARGINKWIEAIPHSNFLYESKGAEKRASKTE